MSLSYIDVRAIIADQAELIVLRAESIQLHTEIASLMEAAKTSAEERTQIAARIAAARNQSQVVEDKLRGILPPSA